MVEYGLLAVFIGVVGHISPIEFNPGTDNLTDRRRRFCNRGTNYADRR